MSEIIEISYEALPTIKLFHESSEQIRCIVGPVGSGKTSGATLEICYYLPFYLYEKYNIKKTRWAIIRNTYSELIDTTQRTVFEWFPWGHHQVQKKNYIIKYNDGIEIELMFRSCDRPEDVKKFKSLEITGYWIDESIEVKEEIKLMLKNRIGRFPKKSPVRFGIETTNPPDVEHPTYSMYNWNVPPPGPIPDGTPRENHAGFWQPPGENYANLRPGYYEDLRSDYRDNPDWADMYIDGKPGIIAEGKLIYNNFKRQYHVAEQPLIWSGGTIYRGWDNSGNCPACVLVQIPTPNHAQILRSWREDKKGIVDFTRWVTVKCNTEFHDAEFEDWGDPAGENKFSKRSGGFTSNAQLMRDECGINPRPSDQNFMARVQAVDQQLAKIDGVLIDPSCISLINGFLGGYHYPEIGTTGTYSDKPTKNRFSHEHDALQYVFVKIFRSSAGLTASSRMTQQKANEMMQKYGPPRRAA